MPSIGKNGRSLCLFSISPLQYRVIEYGQMNTRNQMNLFGTVCLLDIHVNQRCNWARFYCCLLAFPLGIILFTASLRTGKKKRRPLTVHSETHLAFQSYNLEIVALMRKTTTTSVNIPLCAYCFKMLDSFVPFCPCVWTSLIFIKAYTAISLSLKWLHLDAKKKYIKTAPTTSSTATIFHTTQTSNANQTWKRQKRAHAQAHTHTTKCGNIVLKTAFY